MEAGRLAKVLAVALALVLLVTTLWAGSTSATAFGVYNPQWDGAADLREQATAVDVDTVVATDTSAYDDVTAGETVALVLSPDEAYGSDGERLQEFVESGGTLVVAEDFGPHSDSLLTRVGASARFDGRLLRDERRYSRNPNFTVATGVTDEPLVDDVPRLTTNHGTSVVQNDATVLVNTSSYAYLDSDRDGDLGEQETMRQYPIATVEKVGNGRVIAVSDPSLFINAMLQRSGNSAFVRSILEGHTTLVLDYSHAEQLPPLTAATLALRGSLFFQLLLGLGGVAVIVLGADRVVPLWRGRPSTEDDAPDPRGLLQSTLNRHPDWEAGRLSRLMTGVMTSEPKEGEDD